MFNFTEDFSAQPEGQIPSTRLTLGVTLPDTSEVDVITAGKSSPKRSGILNF